MQKPAPTLALVMMLGLAGCAATGGKDTPDDRLSDAIWSNKPGVVEKSLKKGNPNGRARPGGSMLAWAFKMKNKEAVQLLLDHGANVNNDIEGFQQVVASGNVSHVKLLVSRGANVKARGGYYNQSVIHFARSKEMLEYLLSQGADIRDPDKDGQPPGFSWSDENPELWRAFVAHGADPVPRNSRGQSHAEFMQAYDQAQYQRTLQHNEEIRQDNAWIQQANENMRRQAEAAAAEQRRRQQAAAPAQDTTCGWACQNAKGAQTELQRMQHDNAYKECIAAGGLNCQ
jgi:ankyrin repeat protein